MKFQSKAIHLNDAIHERHHAVFEEIVHAALFWLASPRQQASSDVVANFWNSRFPGQVRECLVIAEELKRNVTDPEGHDLVVVEVGHNDTNYTTCLHVPSVSFKGYCNYYSVPTGAKKSVNAV